MFHNRVGPSSRSIMVLLVFASFIALFCFIIQNIPDSNTTVPIFAKTSTERIRRNKSTIDFTDLDMYTFKGLISLKELYEEFYKPSGYEIMKPTLPVPKLRMVKEPTCEEVFSEALRVFEQPKLKKSTKQFPIGIPGDYMMSGYAALLRENINNVRNASQPTDWYQSEEFVRFSKQNLYQQKYQAESESIYNAMRAIRLDGKSGFIIGNKKPWLEVMAIQHGARKVLTVEHFPVKIPNGFKNRISTIHQNDFARNWTQYHKSFDFAASFSNIQHYGLGRFGGPLDAFGDLREMLKTRCLLKKGGLLFLGVPIGIDALIYNVQRIYGPVRMAMMFFGYEWIATFSHTSYEPITLTNETFSSDRAFKYQYYTLVLRKSSQSFI